MAAKKDKMIPSEKERKRALKYATPAGTGRMWVTMGIAFVIFGIILLLIPIGLVISEASAQRYDPESIHTATLVFYLLGAFFGFCGCFCVIFGKLVVKAFAKMLSKGEINYPVAEYKTPKKLLLQEAAAINQSPNAPLTASTFGNWIDFEADWQNCLSIHNGILQSHQIFKKLILVQDNFTYKELFLSKRVACSYGGFANDQLRRLQMGLLRNGNSPEWLKNKFEKRSLERVLAAQNKFDDFSLSISEDEDEDGKHPLLISGNMSNYPVTSLKSMLKGLCTTIEQYEKPQNPKALKDAVHINKHAMHIVRLYYTAFDILEQGKIITRRGKEHEELLAIRNGKYMREDGTYEPAFFDMVDSFEARFQKAVKESVLPAKPNMQKIEELLVAINKSYLSRTM